METIANKPLRIVWLKAAVLGSLWASVEIILGSFLHNLRVPFSGSTLAFMAVWLLIAFSQHWKDKGLIWRAGLIAALMKSLSPSAVILGPMIGIFTEALLIDITIRLLGRNLVACIIGGALAVLSALMHKVVNLLILYGFDLLKVLHAMFEFSQQVLNLEHIGLQEAFFALVAIYATAGIVAALLGYFSGMRIKRKNIAFDNDTENRHKNEHGFINLKKKEVGSLSSKKTSELFDYTTAEKYASPLLFANLFALVGGLFLISRSHMLVAAVFSAAYIGFCFFRYRRAVMRMRKLSFWLPFILITLAAALLLEGMDKGLSFSIDGLIIGIRMNVRAFVVLTGFTAISTEMKNPAIKMILYKKGFENLYQALNLSFGALPGIIAFISERNGKQGLRRFSLKQVLAAAEQLLATFKKENAQKMPVIIITGAIGQGKTTFTKQVIKLLNNKKVSITGFLSLGKQQDGQRVGFDLYSLLDQSLTPLCTTEKLPGRPHFGRYYFHDEGLQKGNEILEPDVVKNFNLLVVDEVGPLEINNSGWAKGIENVLNNAQVLQCWVVRKSLVQQIARKWDIGTAYVFDISEDSEEEVVKCIGMLLKNADDLKTV